MRAEARGRRPAPNPNPRDLVGLERGRECRCGRGGGAGVPCQCWEEGCGQQLVAFRYDKRNRRWGVLIPIGSGFFGKVPLASARGRQRPASAVLSEELIWVFLFMSALAPFLPHKTFRYLAVFSLCPSDILPASLETNRD